VQARVRLVSSPAGAGPGGTEPKGVDGVGEQPVPDFAGLLRQLRGQARLTQQELAEAAGLSPRAVSDLERGIHRTARKDTGLLLADALGLAGPARELFVAAARGRGPAQGVLAVWEGRTPGTGGGTARWAHGCPYGGLLPFSESDAEVFYGGVLMFQSWRARCKTASSWSGRCPNPSSGWRSPARPRRPGSASTPG
jgi:DNA-binding XRE family transcriptional regulator